MNTPDDVLTRLLADLTVRARALSLKDVEWAERAGIRHETLCRLRRRNSCDLSTLQALANAVGAQVVVTGAGGTPLVADGHFPAALSREDEARLLRLATVSTAFDAWAEAGPRFFMAGLAVTLAGEPGYDRQSMLALAERLHPGASLPEVFTRWLARSPLRPSRFLPLLVMERRHAA
jgi:hypothetical protein